MAKFIQVHSVADNHSYYINVETVRYVLQDPHNAKQSSIRFVGEEHPAVLMISEPAASFVSRAGAD
jgi:hypothetical protein